MTLRWLRQNWFALGLLFVLVVAFLAAPALRAADPGGVLRGTLRTSVVIVIFVVIGMILPGEEVLSGLLRVRVYLVTQLFIFAVVPLVMAVFLVVVSFLDGAGIVTPAVRVGLLALAVLPTTGSSCVVFTETARGNTSAATANSTLANILGVFLSPLLLSMILRAGVQIQPVSQVGSVLVGLLQQMILPLAVGQGIRGILRRRVTAAYVALEPRMRDAVSALIIAVVFLSAGGAFEGQQRLDPATTAVVLFLALFHITILALAWLTGWLTFSERADRIALLFTGTQKTLALGIPLLSLYFRGQPYLLAAALGPLIFYHLWQLMVGGLVANHLRSSRR